jgi:hypothetical protein
VPIRCIIHFAQEILNNPELAGSHEAATMIKNTGKLLLAQIQGLLDHSLIESGRFEPALAPTQLY